VPFNFIIAKNYRVHDRGNIVQVLEGSPRFIAKCSTRLFTFYYARLAIISLIMSILAKCYLLSLIVIRDSFGYETIRHKDVSETHHGFALDSLVPSEKYCIIKRARMVSSGLRVSIVEYVVSISLVDTVSRDRDKTPFS
jgi:hypothetical protein